MTNLGWLEGQKWDTRWNWKEGPVKVNHNIQPLIAASKSGKSKAITKSPFPTNSDKDSSFWTTNEILNKY